MGLVVGLLVGLALALGVALYVTKVPIPFMNKVPQRSAGQDAAEAEKNKNWDPNAPLAGKSAAPPAASASGVVAPAVPPTLPPPVTTAPTTDPNAAGGRDPAAILADRPAAAPPRTRPSTSTASGTDPFTYLVQAGAYSRAEDAEQQRARLALIGLTAKVSEREQAGRTMYRVRVGPFDKKDDADAVKERLAGSGVEAALVRVQR
ncbi:MAG: SPOR domain-containing protein [Burkholderiaceae bacterium]